MLIKLNFYYAGMESFVSKAGNRFATVFVHPLKDDGTHDLKQVQARAFGDELVEKLSRVKAGSTVLLDVEVKDAVVRGVADADEVVDFFGKN